MLRSSVNIFEGARGRETQRKVSEKKQIAEKG